MSFAYIMANNLIALRISYSHFCGIVLTQNIECLCIFKCLIFNYPSLVAILVLHWMVSLMYIEVQLSAEQIIIFN